MDFERATKNKIREDNFWIDQEKVKPERELEAIESKTAAPAKSNVRYSKLDYRNSRLQSLQEQSYS